MQLRNFPNPGKRRHALEKEIHVKFPNIGAYDFEETQAEEKNCENIIGVARIPLGIAGPLKITHLESKSDNYYIPLATTEGALVASINRGCKAIFESGGAVVDSCRSGTTRGPVFYTGSIAVKNTLFTWVKMNEETIKKLAESTSSHLHLKKVMIRSLADYSFVRFSFDTEDAMGMNMATIASEKIIALIEKETGASCISVAGNFDIDKKPAWLNVIEPRGIKAWAEVTLFADVIKNTLKTTSQSIFDVWYAKCMLGSAMSGSLAFNAHFSNVVAAIFIATGQDPAHVVEGSLGVTTAKVLKNGDLYIAVYLPSLMIGTVGGGTALPTQYEALTMLGVTGNGKVERFAEIIAG
ncbi:MAG TPA: hydroxymethylglutaryl-CoA reductase, partial [Patescibacteria group bacterium]|nr:hydroxymethylglutaryl-CoA reductase [Patescibacteria group bacterium]